MSANLPGRPDTLTGEATVRAWLDRHGQTYAEQAGIRLAAALTRIAEDEQAAGAVLGTARG
jgi:hypothetical protein